MQMDGPLIARDDFRLGMVYRARLHGDWFAEGDDLVAFREIFLHVRSVPPAAMEARGAVVEHDFENRFFAVCEPFDAHGNNFPARSDWFAQPNLCDRPKPVAIFVAYRAMQQQVFNRDDAKAR